jgi:D-alanyl-lipoteichoic acid acyltransferase DltB (MBOAT superfamily)
MGIYFPENFNFPYMSSSPREFWRRWHISLSSWIRDYLYLPLLGQAVDSDSADGLTTATNSAPRRRFSPVLALLTTWIIMGFWHGANWTFVLWGLLQGLLVLVYRVMLPTAIYFPSTVTRFFGWVLTIPTVMLAWVAFRADTVEATLAMYKKLFSLSEWTYLGMRENTYLVTALIFLFMIIFYYIHEHAFERYRTLRWGGWVAEAGIMGLAASLGFIFLRPINQFIYFQF